MRRGPFLKTSSVAYSILLLGPLQLYGSNFGHRGNLTLNAQVVENGLGQPEHISGSVDIDLENPTQQLCFYLPLNDKPLPHKNYIPTRLKDIETSIESSSGTGSIKVFESPDFRSTSLSPAIVRIEFDENIKQTTLLFETTLVSPERDEWFVEDFYPYLLEDCEGTHRESRLNQRLSLESSPHWQIIAAHSVGQNLHRTEAFTKGPGAFSFILTRKIYTQSESKAPFPVLVYTQAKGHEVLSTLSTFLASHTNLFGPYPFNSLTFVESESLPTLSRQGFVILNRPRQKIFESLQNDVLNWKYWILASILAHQWYGESIRAASPMDAWLIEGMIEYATFHSVSQFPRRSNLFNTWDHGYSFLDFSYLQYQNLSAQLLYRDQPFLILTDKDLQSVTSSKMAYLKHALALRHLKALLGDNDFREFMQKFTQGHLSYFIKPGDFHEALSLFVTQTGKRSKDATQILAPWWQSKNWPNISIVDMQKHAVDDTLWSTKLHIKNQTGLSTPVSIYGKNGQEQKIPTASFDTSETEFLSDFEPLYAKIDPQNLIFDTNRFDNSTQNPSMEIIPGPGRTFSDEKYTTVWMPFALRSPGEQTSVGVRAGTFRYLHSWLHLKVEGKPEEGSSAYQLEFQKKIPLLRSKLKIDHALNYFGDQITSTGLEKEFEWSENKVQVLAQVSQRRIVGRENTGVESVTVGLNIPSIDLLGNCTHSLSTSSESSLRFAQSSVPYSRLIFNPSLTCKPVPELQTSVRLFGGRLYTQNEVPSYTLFRVNDLSEAGLRIDNANLAPERTINAASFEILTPFPIIFIPDSVFLVRKMKFKLFYDIGYTESWDPTKRMRAAGTSLILPLGGDVIGAGTLVLSQFSVTSVFYTDYYGEVSRSPRILFDISGTL